MAKTNTPQPRKLTWRDYSDAAHPPLLSRPNPESLHPSASTIERAVAGDEEARAIADSYGFRFPVTILRAAVIA